MVTETPHICPYCQESPAYWKLVSSTQISSRQTVYQTNKSYSVGKGIAGTLLLGPVGAVMGINGKTNTTSSVVGEDLYENSVQCDNCSGVYRFTTRSRVWSTDLRSRPSYSKSSSQKKAEAERAARSGSSSSTRSYTGSSSSSSTRSYTGSSSSSSTRSYTGSSSSSSRSYTGSSYSEPETWTCSICYKKSPADSSFCAYCGKPRTISGGSSSGASSSRVTSTPAARTPAASVNTTAATSAHPANRPVPPKPVHSTSGLQRGQKALLAGATKLNVEIGWFCNVFTADAVAFVLDSTNKVGSSADYLNSDHLTDSSNAVKLTYRDEKVSLDVDLTKLPVSVEKIVFAICTNDKKGCKGNLASLKNTYISVFDKNTSKEILCYDVPMLDSFSQAVVLGEIYKKNGEWKFNAVGSGYRDPLSSICSKYGVV